MSRKHAEIRKVGDAFFLADLHSRNKTKVNNTEVKPGNDHRLKPGDRINICDVEFIFYPAPPEGDAPEADGNIMVVTEGDDVDDPQHAHARRLALQRPGQRGPARGQAQGDPGDHPQPLQRAARSTPSPPRSSTR